MKKRILSLVLVVVLVFSFIPLGSAGMVQKAQAQVSLSGLYAGGNNPGVVYHYEGSTRWVPVSYDGRPAELGRAVLSLTEFVGTLYAGTVGQDGVGRVYRYTGEVGLFPSSINGWELVGDGSGIDPTVANLDNQVSSLTVWNGQLYAGTSRQGGRLYRYDESQDRWIRVIDYSGWSGLRTMEPWNGFLYLGDIGWDKIGRYDGTTFQYLVYLGGSCIWDFEPYGDNLYASAWLGSLYKSSTGTDWTRIYSNPEWRNIWALKTFQNNMYLGMDWTGSGTQEAQLWKYDGTSLQQVWQTPVGNYDEGILSLATDGNYLFMGLGGEAGYYYQTSGEGKVYAYDGNQAQLISRPGEMGTGIQSFYLASPISSPGLEFTAPFDFSDHSATWSWAAWLDWLFGKAASYSFARESDGALALVVSASGGIARSEKDRLAISGYTEAGVENYTPSFSGNLRIDATFSLYGADIAAAGKNVQTATTDALQIVGSLFPGDPQIEIPPPAIPESPPQSWLRFPKAAASINSRAYIRVLPSGSTTDLQITNITYEEGKNLVFPIFNNGHYYEKIVVSRIVPVQTDVPISISAGFSGDVWVTGNSTAMVIYGAKLVSIRLTEE